MTRRLSTPTLIGLAVLALLAASLVALRLNSPSIRVTAYFDNVTGLYVGDDVTAIGVPVGSIASIEPQRGQVKVVLELDHDVELASNAEAAIIAPALVAVRHIEIGPLHTSGPTLRSGATIGLERTAVPVEWDEVKTQLVTLSEQLGPDGANADGAVSRLLETSAENLDGQGVPLSQTLQDVSSAMQTLAENRGDLFGTVRHLQLFTDTLRSSDLQIRQFTSNLAQISQILDDQRTELVKALDSTHRALGDAQGFLEDHRAELRTAALDAGHAADLVASNRRGLADLLQLLPTTLSNLYNIYDPILPAYTGVLAAAQTSSPATFVCSTLFSLGGTPEQCQSALGPLLELARMDPPPIGISPLERNGYDNDGEGQ